MKQSSGNQGSIWNTKSLTSGFYFDLFCHLHKTCFVSNQQTRELLISVEKYHTNTTNYKGISHLWQLSPGMLVNKKVHNLHQTQVFVIAFSWPWELHVLGCWVDTLGTNCDQCLSMVQCCFMSTETIRLISTASLGWPPWLWHSSWTLCYCDIFWTLMNSFACWFYTGTAASFCFKLF